MSWHQHAGLLLTSKPAFSWRLTRLLERSSLVPSSALFCGCRDAQSDPTKKGKRSLADEADYASLIADPVAFAQGAKQPASEVAGVSLSPSTTVACQLLCDLAFLAAPMTGTASSSSATGNRSKATDQLDLLFSSHFDKLRMHSQLSAKRFMICGLYADSSINQSRALAARCLLELGLEAWGRGNALSARLHSAARPGTIPNPGKLNGVAIRNEAGRVAAAAVDIMSQLVSSAHCARHHREVNDPDVDVDASWYGFGETVAILHYHLLSSVGGGLVARDPIYAATDVLEKPFCSADVTKANNISQVDELSLVESMAHNRGDDDGDEVTVEDEAEGGGSGTAQNQRDSRYVNVGFARNWTAVTAAHMVCALERAVFASPTSPLWIGRLLASDPSTLTRLHCNHLPHQHAQRHSCTKEYAYLAQIGREENSHTRRTNSRSTNVADHTAHLCRLTLGFLREELQAAEELLGLHRDEKKSQNEAVQSIRHFLWLPLAEREQLVRSSAVGASLVDELVAASSCKSSEDSDDIDSASEFGCLTAHAVGAVVAQQAETTSTQPASRRGVNVPLLAVLVNLLPMVLCLQQRDAEDSKADETQHSLLARLDGVLRLVLNVLGFFTLAVARRHAQGSADSVEHRGEPLLRLVDSLLRAQLVLQRGLQTGVRCLEAASHFRCVRAQDHPLYRCATAAIAATRATKSNSAKSPIAVGLRCLPDELFPASTALHGVTRLVQSLDRCYTDVATLLAHDELRDVWIEHHRQLRGKSEQRVPAGCLDIGFPELRQRDFFTGSTDAIRLVHQMQCMLSNMHVLLCKDRVATPLLPLPLHVDETRTTQLPHASRSHSLYIDVLAAVTHEEGGTSSEIEVACCDDLPGVSRLLTLLGRDDEEGSTVDGIRTVGKGASSFAVALRMCRLFAAAEDELRLAVTLALSPVSHRLYTPLWDDVLAECIRLLRRAFGGAADAFPEPALLGESVVHFSTKSARSGWEKKVARVLERQRVADQNDRSCEAREHRALLSELRRLVDDAALAPLLAALSVDLLSRSCVVLRGSSADGLRFDVSRHVLHLIHAAPKWHRHLSDTTPVKARADRLFFSIVDPQLYGLALTSLVQLLEAVSADVASGPASPQGMTEWQRQDPSEALLANEAMSGASGGEADEYDATAIDNDGEPREGESSAVKQRRLGAAKAVALSFVSGTQRKHVGALATEYLVDVGPVTIRMCRAAFVTEACRFSPAFAAGRGRDELSVRALEYLRLFNAAQARSLRDCCGKDCAAVTKQLQLQRRLVMAGAPCLGVVFSRLAINTHTSILCFAAMQTTDRRANGIRLDVAAELEVLMRRSAQLMAALPPSSSKSSLERSFVRAEISYDQHSAMLAFSALVFSLQTHLDEQAGSSPSASFRFSASTTKVFNTLVLLGLVKDVLPRLERVVEASDFDTMLGELHQLEDKKQQRDGEDEGLCGPRRQWLSSSTSAPLAGARTAVESRGALMWMTPFSHRTRTAFGESETIALFERAVLALEFLAPFASVPLLREAIIDGASHHQQTTQLPHTPRHLSDVVFMTAEEFADAVVSSFGEDDHGDGVAEKLDVRQRAHSKWSNKRAVDAAAEEGHAGAVISIAAAARALLVFSTRRIASLYLVNVSVSRFHTQAMTATQLYTGRHRPEHAFQALVVLQQVTQHLEATGGDDNNAQRHSIVELRELIGHEVSVLRAGFASSFTAIVMLHLPIDTIIAWAEYLSRFITPLNNKRLATKMLTHVLRRGGTSELRRGSDYKRFGRFVRLGLLSASWGVAGQTQVALGYAASALQCVVTRHARLGSSEGDYGSSRGQRGGARGATGSASISSGGGSVSAQLLLENNHVKRVLGVVRDAATSATGAATTTTSNSVGATRSHLECVEDADGGYFSSAYVPPLLHLLRALVFVRDHALAPPPRVRRELRSGVHFFKDQLLRQQASTTATTMSGLLHPATRLVLLRSLQLAGAPLSYAETRQLIADVAPAKPHVPLQQQQQRDDDALFPYPFVACAHHHVASAATCELLAAVLLRSQLGGSAPCTELATQLMASVATGGCRSRSALHRAFEVQVQTPTRRDDGAVQQQLDLFDIDVECDDVAAAASSLTSTDTRHRNSSYSYYATAVPSRHSFLSPHVTEEDALRLMATTWQLTKADSGFLSAMANALLLSVPPRFPTDALLSLVAGAEAKKSSERRHLSALKFTTVSWLQSFGRCFVGQWPTTLTRAVTAYTSATHLRRLSTPAPTMAQPQQQRLGLFPHVQMPAHVVAATLLDMNGGEEFFLSATGGKSARRGNVALLRRLRFAVGDSFVRLNQSIADYAELPPLARDLCDLTAIANMINGCVIYALDDGATDIDTRSDVLRSYGALLFYTGRTIQLDEEAAAAAKETSDQTFQKHQLRDVCVDGPTAVGSLVNYSVGSLRVGNGHLASLVVAESEPPYVASNALAVQQVNFVKGGLKFSSEKHFSLVLDCVRNSLQRGAPFERVLATIELVLARESPTDRQRTRALNQAADEQDDDSDDDAVTKMNKKTTAAAAARAPGYNAASSLERQLSQCIGLLGATAETRTTEIAASPNQCIRLLLLLCDPRWGSGTSDSATTRSQLQRLLTRFVGVAVAQVQRMSPEEQHYCLCTLQHQKQHQEQQQEDGHTIVEVNAALQHVANGAARVAERSESPYVEARMLVILLPLLRNLELRMGMPFTAASVVGGGGGGGGAEDGAAAATRSLNATALASAARVLLRRWLIVSALHRVPNIADLRDISFLTTYVRELDRNVSKPASVKDPMLRRLALELVETAARRL